MASNEPMVLKVLSLFGALNKPYVYLPLYEGSKVIGLRSTDVIVLEPHHSIQGPFVPIHHVQFRFARVDDLIYPDDRYIGSINESIHVFVKGY